MNLFLKRKALSLAKQKVVSETMNKLKPVSRGGTRLVTVDDIKIATIEMSESIIKTQMALRGKEDRIWRANI